jgi:tRNA(Ile)-lysidine synthase
LNNLSWVEDMSNQDLQMDRNYLRHEILPAITARFPAAEKALLNGLERDRNVSLLIEEIAETDLESALSEDGGLKLRALHNLSELRVVNLLRQYLRLKNVPFPSGNMLRECAAVMLRARKDAAPVLKWASYEFRRHGEILYLLRDMRSVDSSISTAWDPAAKLQIGDGTLSASLVEGLGNLAGSTLPLEVRFRQGGEQIKLDHSRRVKKLFQENNVPEWLRARIPLIFQGDQLVAIPGIPAWKVPPVISRAHRAKTGENGWMITFDIDDRL